MKERDRFLFGMILFMVVLVGGVLYITRGNNDPTTQAAPISAPDAPLGAAGGGGGGGKK